MNSFQKSLSESINLCFTLMVSPISLKIISFREIIGFRWGLPNKSSHKLDLVWINASNLHRKFIFGKIDYVNYVLSCRGNVRLSFSDSDSLFIPLKAVVRAQNQSVIGPPTRFLGFNLTFQKLPMRPCPSRATVILNKIFTLTLMLKLKLVVFWNLNYWEPMDQFACHNEMLIAIFMV